MRATVVRFAAALLLCGSMARGAEPADSAPPVVEQLLANAAALQLTTTQVGTLEIIRDRRAHTLAALQERLRGSDAQTSAAAEQDALALMQEIGRLQVLSGREALHALSPAQRQRWVEVHRALHTQ